MVIFNSKLLVYQRVNGPFGLIFYRCKMVQLFQLAKTVRSLTGLGSAGPGTDSHSHSELGKFNREQGFS